MSETELAHRFIASRARIASDRLRKGQVTKEWRRWCKACNELAEAPLWIDDSSDLSLLDLRAKCRRLVASARASLGLIIVDYIQLMRADDPRAGRVEQVGQMSRGLKILARELEVPVIGISQLSRAPEQRPDKVPILSDLRESGSIEQDADIVVFIYRDEYYNKEESERPGEADLIIAKHRNGPIGTVPLAFLEQFPHFANLARGYGGERRARRGGRVSDEDGAAGAAGRSAAPRLAAGRSARRGALPGGPLLREGGEVTVREARSACPLGVCDGSGWIIGPEDDRPALRVPRAADREGARRAACAASLPKRYRGVSFDRPPVSDMARGPGSRGRSPRSATSAAGSTTTSTQGAALWLMGDVGTGKTTLAMLVSKAALEAGHSVAIYSLPRLLARIRRTYDADAGEESYLAFFQRLDLGRPAPPRRPRRREADRLGARAALRDRRPSATRTQRSMVVTTNLEEPELEEQIGTRIVSRLVEMCGDPLPLYGDDQRYRLEYGRGPSPGPAPPA